MEKTIKIGEKNIRLRATAGFLLRYRQQFGKEYISDLKDLNELEPDSENKLLKALTVGFHLVWAMAKTADVDTPPPEDFLQIFDGDSLVLSSAIEQAEELFSKSLEGAKGGEQGEEVTSEKLIAIAAHCGLCITDIDTLSVAMLMNTIDEYINIQNGGKSSDGTHKATQADFDKF